MTKVASFLLPAVLACLAACTTPPVVGSSLSKHGDDGDAKTAKGGHATAGSGDVGDDDDGTGTSASTSTTSSSTTSSVPDEPDPIVDTAEIDPFFAKAMDDGNIPGVSVAVVRDGHLKWTKGYGFADLAAKKPVARDTLFMLASVSKTITTVALMQLIEDPKNGVTLDSDINEKLDFSVRNPRFTSTPITYRMLLTHTSSLIDGAKYFDTPYAKGDSATSLVSFEKSAIADAARWQKNKPGAKFEYSNTAIALAGLLAEKMAGTDLQTYAKSHIFDRLGMKETSYFFKGLDPSHIAIPYNGTNLAPQGYYGYPDYPAGQVRTSAPQLARFLMMFSEGGALRSVRLLKTETVTEMQRAQVPSIAPTQRITFFTDTKGGVTALGHDGADKGVTTQMFFDPKTKAGYVLLTNARDQLDDVSVADAALTRISDKLMDLARTLP